MDRLARTSTGEGVVRGAKMARRIGAVGADSLTQRDLGAHALAETAAQRGDDEEDDRGAEDAKERPHQTEVDLRTREPREEALQREDDGVEERERPRRLVDGAQGIAQRRVRSASVDRGREHALGERELRIDEHERGIDRGIVRSDAVRESDIVDRELAGRERDRGRHRQDQASAGHRGVPCRAGHRTRLNDERPRVCETLPVVARRDGVRVSDERLREPQQGGQREDAGHAWRGNASAAICRSSASLRTRRSK